MRDIRTLPRKGRGVLPLVRVVPMMRTRGVHQARTARPATSRADNGAGLRGTARIERQSLRRAGQIPARHAAAYSARCGASRLAAHAGAKSVLPVCSCAAHAHAGLKSVQDPSGAVDSQSAGAVERYPSADAGSQSPRRVKLETTAPANWRIVRESCPFATSRVAARAAGSQIARVAARAGSQIALLSYFVHVAFHAQRRLLRTPRPAFLRLYRRSTP